MNIKTFEDFNLNINILDSLKDLLFFKPTEIQKRAIPYCLRDKNVIVQAKTGTGKTLVYVLPIIQKILSIENYHNSGIISIIITPTSELALQVQDVIKHLINKTRISTLAVVGDRNISDDKTEAKNLSFTNILICTPGKLLYHFKNNISLASPMNYFEYLVLDEVDMLLEDTFISDLKKIFTYIPSDRKTWAFSATASLLNSKLDILKMQDPVSIGYNQQEKEVNYQIPMNLKQEYIEVNFDRKHYALLNIFKKTKLSKIIVFFSTQKQVGFYYSLFKKFNLNYSLFKLMSKMRLDKRDNSINEFKNQKTPSILFCTDVACRGIDIPDIKMVVQFDLPRNVEDYIHRVGRTARYCNRGLSCLFVMSGELSALKYFQHYGINISLSDNQANLVEIQLSEIVRNQMENFIRIPEINHLANKALDSLILYYDRNRPDFIINNETILKFEFSDLNMKEFLRILGRIIIPKSTLFREKRSKRRPFTHKHGSVLSEDLLLNIYQQIASEEAAVPTKKSKK